MTLVIAAIDRDTGAVSLGADSKVTWAEDATRTRRVYTEPALKIVLLGDDLAVGYAGEGPSFLASAVANLNALGLDETLAGLTQIAGGSFVVGQRDPARIWSVSAKLGIEERTTIGRAWAGDQDAFSTFQSLFDQSPGNPALTRLQETMQHIVHTGRSEPVGGYTILISGDRATPFHYLALWSSLWPEAVEASVSVPTRNPDGTINFVLRASFDEAPLILHVVPGTAPTSGAIGLYVENALIGYLYPHLTPARRLTIRASTFEEFVTLAKESHGQSLVTDRVADKS